MFITRWIHLLLHSWSFFFAALVLLAVGEVIKRIFPRHDVNGFHAFVWAFLPLTLVVIGGLFGLLCAVPVPAVMSGFGHIASSVYFASAGVFASFISALHYSVKTHLIKG